MVFLRDQKTCECSVLPQSVQFQCPEHLFKLKGGVVHWMQCLFTLKCWNSPSYKLVGSLTKSALKELKKVPKRSQLKQWGHTMYELKHALMRMHVWASIAIRKLYTKNSSAEGPLIEAKGIVGAGELNQIITCTTSQKDQSIFLWFFLRRLNLTAAYWHCCKKKLKRIEKLITTVFNIFRQSMPQLKTFCT